MTWGSSSDDAVLFDDPNADPIVFDEIPFELLFPPSPPVSALPPAGSTQPTSGSAAGTVAGGL